MTMSLDPFESMLQLEMPQLPAGFPGVNPMIQMPAPEADPMAGLPQVPGMPAQGVADFLRQLEQQGAFEQAKPQTAKGLQVGGQTVKEEQGGPDARMRAEGAAARGLEQMENAQVDVDRQLANAEALERRANELRAQVQVEREERQRQERELAAKQERLRGQQMELAKQNDEPINPQRYFQNMSLFSKAATVLSAAVSGYFRPGSAAPIMDTLVQAAQADVQAQIADRQANRAQRATLIDQYERQYGDTTLVAKRLEADKLLTLAKEAEARGLDAKSQDGKAMAEDLAKKLKNHVGVLHREIQEATAGKPIEVTTTYQQPKPKGSGDPNKLLKEALEMDALLEKRGYTREERAAMLQAAKLPPPGGQTEAELKRADEAAARDAKAKEIGSAEKQKLIERVDGLAEAKAGFEELDKLAGIERDENGEVKRAAGKKLDSAIPGRVPQVIEAVGGAIPFGVGEKLGAFARDTQPEDVKSLRRAANKITSGMAHAESGAGVSGPEMEDYRSRLPITSEEGFKKASAEMWREQRQKYRNLVGQYGKDVVDEMLRKRGLDPRAYGG